jgi:Protein of unknown function (DUF4238)
MDADCAQDLQHADDAMPMTQHRYIPRFLLDRWAFKGRLCSYYWSHDAAEVVENRSILARSTGLIDDLHAFYGLPSPPRDAPERELFASHVDAPAAHALSVMFARGVPALTPGERNAWARLIVTFALRTPETLHSMGAAEFREAMRIAHGNAEHAAELEAIAAGLSGHQRPTLERGVALRRALELASNPGKLAAVAGMQWWLRRFEGKTVLLSDRPLLSQPRMPDPCGIAPEDPDGLIILPVAPDTVFFATPNPAKRAKMRKTPKGKLANMINEEAVWRAADCVYAPDDSMSAFVHDRIVGKVKGGWHPK